MLCTQMHLHNYSSKAISNAPSWRLGCGAHFKTPCPSPKLCQQEQESFISILGHHVQKRESRNWFHGLVIPRVEIDQEHCKERHSSDSCDDAVSLSVWRTDTEPSRGCNQAVQVSPSAAPFEIEEDNTEHVLQSRTCPPAFSNRVSWAGCLSTVLFCNLVDGMHVLGHTRSIWCEDCVTCLFAQACKNTGRRAIV